MYATTHGIEGITNENDFLTYPLEVKEPEYPFEIPDHVRNFTKEQFEMLALSKRLESKAEHERQIQERKQNGIRKPSS